MESIGVVRRGWRCIMTKRKESAMTGKTTKTIISAVSGWHVAIFVPGDDCHADSLDLQPIIAWEIERYERDDKYVTHWVMPLTIHGNMIDDCTNHWAIKRPDGKLEILMDSTYDDEADLMVELKRLHDRDVARERRHRGYVSEAEKERRANDQSAALA
jgi:hypothetical protein